MPSLDRRRQEDYHESEWYRVRPCFTASTHQKETETFLKPLIVSKEGRMAVFLFLGLDLDQRIWILKTENPKLGNLFTVSIPGHSTLDADPYLQSTPQTFIFNIKLIA